MKIRSIILFTLINFLMVFFSILGILEAMFSSKFLMARFFARSGLYLAKKICNVDYKIIGNLPKDRSFIIASKHQSAFETMIFVHEFKTLNFILKKELYFIPFVGLYCKILGMTFIDRKNAKSSLQAIKKAAIGEKEKKIGHLVIFPESTRVSIKSNPNYKSGIFSLYSYANTPVVPIGVNTGLYWSNKNKIKSGTAIIEILQPIEIGLSKKEFMSILEEKIESSVKKLNTLS